MAAIVSAIWDTEENQRTPITEQFLLGLRKTVDWDRHRLILVDQNSCQETKHLLHRCHMARKWWHESKLIDGYDDTFPPATVITLPENVGTARGINKGWALRRPGENAIKADNDFRVEQAGWVDILEECVERDPKIGIAACKRRDLSQWAGTNDPPGERTRLIALPHKLGERWLVVEKCKNSFGTVQLYNSGLLDVMGGLIQPSLYGWDDCLSDIRCEVAGFYCAFVPQIDLEYLDKSTWEDAYQIQKGEEAKRTLPEFEKMAEEFRAGTRSIFVPLE